MPVATPIDSSTITAMINNAGGVSLPAGLSAATFGVPSGTSLYSTINNHLASLSTSVAGIMPPLSNLAGEVDAVATGVTATLDSVCGRGPLTHIVPALLPALYARVMYSSHN